MTTAAVFVPGLRKAFRISILLAGAAVLAAAPPQVARSAEGKAAQQIEREVIPNADLMTDAERDAYRRRMQAAATPQAKAKVRAEFAKTAAAAAPESLVGDAQRGSKLHSACFGCHGIERYTQGVTYAMASFTDSVLRASGLSDIPPEPTRFKGKIQSLPALREAVIRRNEFFNPKMTPQEVADVLAYLNATYYKFPQ
jgi:hypothetical protein